MFKNAISGYRKPGLLYTFTFMEGLYGRIVHGEGGDVRVEGDGHHAANNSPFPSVFLYQMVKKIVPKV
jgi:hypothetical protein